MRDGRVELEAAARREVARQQRQARMASLRMRVESPPGTTRWPGGDLQAMAVLPPPKAYQRAGRHGRQTYTPPDERRWRVEATRAIVAGRPEVALAGPVFVRVDVEYARPVRRPVGVGAEAWAAGGRVRVPSGRMDLDNVVKLVLDTVTRAGGWWGDDREVAGLLALGWYGAGRVVVRAYGAGCWPDLGGE